MNRHLIRIPAFFLVLLSSDSVLSGYNPNQEDAYVSVLISEAGDQGFGGMLGVAEVLRNRSWRLSGFCGLRRRDLDDYLDRTPRSVFRLARRAIGQARRGSNTVSGATHFENVEDFGIPVWAKDKKVVARIGNHTFFR